MDIREAKYLLEIAKTQNITKAANNLYITQPGLSKSLNKLEEEFEAPLFYREGRNLEPTPIGELILKHSQIIVDDFNAMYDEVREMKHQTEDKLRISLPYSGSYLFTDIISEFTIEYPNIILEPHELGGIQIADMFSNHNLDIAFAMPMGAETSVDLNEHLILQSEVVVGVTRSHPLSSKKRVTYQDLDGCEYISFDSTSQIYKLLNEAFAKEQITAIPKMLGHDYLWLIAYSKRLDTPCILPRPCFDAFDDDDLILLPFDPEFEWPLCLAYPKELQRSNTVQTFIKFAMSRIDY